MFEYIGCFADDNEDDLDGEHKNDNVIDLGFCYEYCSLKGYAYFAMQGQYETFFLKAFF